MTIAMKKEDILHYLTQVLPLRAACRSTSFELGVISVARHVTIAGPEIRAAF
jgi:hypothetical protein